MIEAAEYIIIVDGSFVRKTKEKAVLTKNRQLATRFSSVLGAMNVVENMPKVDSYEIEVNAID